MKINILTIDHKDQRYETVGDYWVDENGAMQVRVSDMGNDDYAFLVAVHEIIEQYLCLKRGIKEEDISNFDKRFEEKRALGLHSENEEPGDDVNAPYRKEHFFATNIERAISLELGTDWKDYDNKVMSL